MAEPSNWEIERPTAASVEAMGIRQAVRFVLRNAAIILCGFAIGITIGLLVQKFTPTAFQSKGKFVVDELPFSKQGSITTDAETERQLVQTLILSIASRDMAAAVAERLNIARDRLSFDEIDQALRLTGPLNQANIEVTATKDSRIGVVTATSQSADFAAEVVNGILDQLQLYNQIGGRLKQVGLDLTLAKSKADSILSQIVTVSERRISLDQQNAELAAYTGRGLPLESFTAFSTDNTLTNLKTQLILVKSQYDSIASTDTRGPRLMGKRSELDGLKAQITQQAKALAGAMKSELEIYTTREKDLQNELSKTQAQIQKLNDYSAQLVQSYGDPVAMRKFIQDTPGQTNNAGNVIVVVDRASPSPKPARPKLALNLALGFILGGLLGFGAAALRTMLDNHLRSPESIEEKTGLPCLALLPPLDPLEKRANIFDRPRSPIGLGFLRNHFLRTSAEGDGRKIIGFTASRRKDDISRLVATLGVLLAQAERRTLIIDLHRKSPRIASMLGVKDGEGLSHWLDTDAPLQDCVGYTAEKGLGVLGLNKQTHTLDDLLGRRPLAVELPKLLEHWDFILIASPAIRFDWTMMLTLPSGGPVVIAADYRKAKADDVRNTLQRSRNTGWRAEGVVLLNCPRNVAGTRAL